jgi:zinc transporter 1/2/3
MCDSSLTIPDAGDALVQETSKPKPTTKAGHSHGQPAQNSHKEKKPTTCKPRKGDTWNLKLRVASIFVIFFTSTIGVLGPVFLSRYTKLTHDGYVFTIIKQFGTGIIISTVFVHLLDHAVLQFDNPCVGELQYEPTPMAVTMSGAFLSFLVDYIGIRILANQTEKSLRRNNEQHQTNQAQQDDAISPVSVEIKDAFAEYDMAQAHIKRNQIEEKKLGVFLMEGGIIFHSISEFEKHILSSRTVG